MKSILKMFQPKILNHTLKIQICHLHLTFQQPLQQVSTNHCKINAVLHEVLIGYINFDFKQLELSI